MWNAKRTRIRIHRKPIQATSSECYSISVSVLPFVWIRVIDLINHGLQTARQVGQITAIGQMFGGKRLDGGPGKVRHLVDLTLAASG